MDDLRCLVVDDEAMSLALIEQYVDRHDGLRLVASCQGAVEAANVLQREPVDIVFLDIEMPEMSGLDLVRSLEERPYVIVVTGKEEYALEAFDVEVVDYLLKPVEYPRFLRAVERVQRRVEQAAASAPRVTSDTVFIKVDGRLVSLDLREVQYIEAQGDYVLICTAAKNYLVHSTMKAMAGRLPGEDFVRVHRSYIVRIDRIKDIQESNLVVEGKMIPIGASYKSDLLDRLQML